jgi:SpoVK/Ycf46/Vps4 family AAA+-type ATPase
VSVADIGLDVTKIEKKLDEKFQLATRWQAVLLFDEADILLEARTNMAELQRNSIVSGMNKQLESN